MSKRLSWLSITVSSCLVSYTAHATWAPRVTALAEMGEFGSVWGDGLFPVQDHTDQVIFFDLQAETNRFYSGDSITGIVSPGFGLRHAFAHDDVLGAYLFSDYVITNSNEKYWLLSPGMDFYRGPVYAAINGYIPVNNAPRKAGEGTAASDLGITGHESFTGNSRYDYLIENFYTMRWGMDLTGGLLFGSKNAWGMKLGAYYYDAHETNAIIGGRGELDYYFNDKVALMIEERYDNVFHNQTIVGIKVSFWGKDNRGTVATQLKAPIYRNLNINTTSAGTAIGEYQQLTTGASFIQGNIVFVSNGPKLQNAELMQFGSIAGDGSFENPYTGLNQEIVNNAGLNKEIWVEGTGASSPYSDAATLTLQTGQSITGRTEGFQLAAINPSTQPIFLFAPTQATAALYIDNTNSLHYFKMHGNGAANSIGVNVANTGSGTAVIHGVTIGTSVADTGYATALFNQGGNVSINDAILYAIEDTVTVSSTGPAAQGVFGIYNDGGTISVNHSTLSSTANTVNYAFDAVGTGISAGSLGIYNANAGVVTLDQSTVDAHANQVNYHADTSTAGGDFVGAFGLYNNAGTITLSDSTVQATADQVIDSREPASGYWSTIGAFGVYNTRGTMTVSGNSSSISATATGVDNIGHDPITLQGLLDYVGAFGVYNSGGGTGNTSTFDLNQATLSASSSTVTSSSFTLNDPSITAIGVWNSGYGGTANATVEQGAEVTVDSTWQITSTLSSGSAVNVFGLYNEGGVNSLNQRGSGYLTVDGATISVTELGGDGAGGGEVAGVLNGTLYLSGNSAVTTIQGATNITASGTGGLISIYGFQNNANFDSTNGTIIQGSTVINSMGGTSGSSSAVYNTIGSMTIQGTADQNITLIANGGSGNNGVLNDNTGTLGVSYATISVGPATANGYSLGITNTSHEAITIDHLTVTVVASQNSSAFGVDNSGSGSMVTISDSTFSLTSSSSGVAYGLWDQGSGITITSATDVNFNYDPINGDAFAFNSTGSYSGEQHVACKYNGSSAACNTN